MTVLSLATDSDRLCIGATISVKITRAVVATDNCLSTVEPLRSRQSRLSRQGNNFQTLDGQSTNTTHINIQIHASIFRNQPDR